VGTIFNMFKLFEVQINLHFGWFGHVKKSLTPNYGCRKQSKCIFDSDRCFEVNRIRIPSSRYRESTVDKLGNCSIYYIYQYCSKQLNSLFHCCLKSYIHCISLQIEQKWKERVNLKFWFIAPLIIRWVNDGLESWKAIGIIIILNFQAAYFPDRHIFQYMNLHCKKSVAYLPKRLIIKICIFPRVQGMGINNIKNRVTPIWKVVKISTFSKLFIYDRGTYQSKLKKRQPF